MRFLSLFMWWSLMQQYPLYLCDYQKDNLQYLYEYYSDNDKDSLEYDFPIYYGEIDGQSKWLSRMNSPQNIDFYFEPLYYDSENWALVTKLKNELPHIIKKTTKPPKTRKTWPNTMTTTKSTSFSYTTRHQHQGTKSKKGQILPQKKNKEHATTGKFTWTVRTIKLSMPQFHGL